MFAFRLFNSSNKTNDDIVLELVNDTLKYLPQRVYSSSEAMTAGLVEPRFRTLNPDPLKQMTQKNKSRDLLLDQPDQTVYVTVLRQEMNRFDRLLALIHSSLSSLRLAVKGEVLMSEQLDEAYNALLSNQVPKAWEVIEHGRCLGGSSGNDVANFVLQFSNSALEMNTDYFVDHQRGVDKG